MDISVEITFENYYHIDKKVLENVKWVKSSDSYH